MVQFRHQGVGDTEVIRLPVWIKRIVHLRPIVDDPWYTNLNLPEFATAQDVADHFGPIAYRTFARPSTDGAAQDRLDIVWIEGLPSEYDRVAESDRGRGRVISGFILGDDFEASFSGFRWQGRLYLYETSYLQGKDVAALGWNGWLTPVIALNQSLEDEAPETLDVHFQAGEGCPATLYLRDGRVGKAIAHGLGGQVLIEHPEPERLPVEEVTWVGGVNDRRDGGLVHARMSILRLQEDRSPTVEIVAIATFRPERRRFEGPVPEQCPWPDRRSFVRALHALEEAEIAWWDGAFDMRAAAVLKEHSGVELDAGEFNTALLDAFGSMEGAIDATCPLPEVYHFSYVLADGAQEAYFRGVYATPAELDDQSNSLLRTLARQITPTSATESGTVVRMNSATLFESETVEADIAAWFKRLQFADPSSE